MEVKRLFNTLLLMALATTVLANERLHDLNIRVVLSKDGDARITEIRRMTVDSEGTECYIPIGDTGRSMVTDLTVSDEQGKAYMPCEAWDVNWSREKKTASVAFWRKAAATSCAGDWAFRVSAPIRPAIP